MEMLTEVGHCLVSTQLFEHKFVCDLNACKGACCVEGNSGAPLTMEEIDLLEDQLEQIEPYMREQGKRSIAKTGVFYMDEDHEPVTTLVNDAECAFVYFDHQGTAKCAIETARHEGKIDFNKPISCHLYPIRVKRLHNKEVLTYDEWDICAPACDCGERLSVPVYSFLKKPLIRAFGNEFYDQLDKVACEWRRRDTL
jgi:hypothetical protein